MLDIKGKRILIIRNGAYGDIIHASHLPRLLKDQGCSHLAFATGFKGYQLMKSNPFIDEFHFFELGDRNIRGEYWDGRIDILSQLYDRTFDLTGSLEVNALALESNRDYYQHIDIRKKYGEHNYYDISTEWIGFPDLIGKYHGEVFFSDEEIKAVEHDLLRPGRYADKFKVIINLSGSSPHKVTIHAKEIAERILEKYEDAVIFTTGAPNMQELDFNLGERTRSLVGKKPFRQVLLMTKYMNCAIGCESGLMVGASMWDIPSIQLLTATSKYCHCKYTTKDYSIQSPARCSPCYKGPYKYYGCPKRDNRPLCVYFNVDNIMEQVDRIYGAEYLLSKTS